MDLVVSPPVKPMLAKAVDGIPDRDDVLFEPKWDGFRCIVFRAGDDVVLGSRNERPLTRYFPEMVPPILAQFPDRCVIDGELIVITDDHLDFDGLQQRIHPADSRVRMLANATPASFVAFDMLALGDVDMRPLPFGERRKALEEVLEGVAPPIHLTATTTDHATAERWFVDFEGAGLDGLIAKPLGDPYLEDKRAQFKVKHVRSADAVLAGFRWHKDEKGVGSFLLGLYDDSGQLHHVGVAASFTAKERAALVDELAPLREGAVDAHPWQAWAAAEAHVDGRMPGAPHRWNAQKDHSWVPLRIERVVEVKYGSTLNGRFREVTKMLRWRPDKTPEQCTFDQLDEPEPLGVRRVLEP
jgi:ATP-dependent DNA ligase